MAAELIISEAITENYIEHDQHLPKKQIYQTDKKTYIVHCLEVHLYARQWSMLGLVSGDYMGSDWGV